MMTVREHIRGPWPGACSLKRRQSLVALGNGAPDLLVGIDGRNQLVEVKDGSKPLSRRHLTPDEAVWHAGWADQVAVASTIDEALSLLLCYT